MAAPSRFSKLSIVDSFENNSATQVAVRDEVTGEINWVLKSSLGTPETTESILTKIGDGTTISQAYLPSYVDDILEFANLSAFPATGEIGKIYIALSPSSKQYRWSGSTYVQITNGLIASTNDVNEGTNLYFTSSRVLATVLAGISFLTSTDVLATDTVLQAIGKLQKQISDNIASILLKEYASNKSNSVADISSTTKFPVWKVITDWAVSLFQTIPTSVTNATTTGAYNLDWSKDTWILTLTGTTTFTQSNLPSAGKTKVISLYVTGNFALTYPAGWTGKIIGTYVGTLNNQIVVEYLASGNYWVTIIQPD